MNERGMTLMKTLKRLPFLLGLLTVVIAFPAASLYAQQRGPGGFDRPGAMQGRSGPGMRGGEMGPMGLIRMAEQLDLTKDQRNSIARIMDATQPKIRDNMFKLMDTRKAMRELLDGKGKVDDRKLRSLTRDQGDAMGEMTYLRLKMRSDIRNVLTEEQLAKLDNFRGQRKGMRADRMRDRRDNMRGQFRNWRQRQQPQQQDAPEQG